MIQNLLVLLTLHPAARSALRDAAQQTTSFGSSRWQPAEPGAEFTCVQARTLIAYD